MDWHVLGAKTRLSSLNLVRGGYACRSRDLAQPVACTEMVVGGLQPGRSGQIADNSVCCHLCPFSPISPEYKEHGVERMVEVSSPRRRKVSVMRQKHEKKDDRSLTPASLVVCIPQF